MGLQETILQKIKEEIINDPEHIGYDGKTTNEILNLLNNPQVKTVTIEEQLQPPISRILSGIAKAPNIASLTDITEALK